MNANHAAHKSGGSRTRRLENHEKKSDEVRQQQAPPAEIAKAHDIPCRTDVWGLEDQAAREPRRRMPFQAARLENQAAREP